MRKSLKGIILYFLAITSFIFAIGVVGWYDTHYYREGIVIKIQNSEVIVQDTTDNKWSFEGDGFNEGDSVTMTMFNNGTYSNIYDDEVENVKVVK